MTSIEILRCTAIAAIAAALLAQAAVAAGEPKNESPFTRPVVTRTAQLATSHPASSTDVRGEPKNEWPFTRRVGIRSTQATGNPTAAEPAIQGEPKNQPPFVKPAPIVISSTDTGFNWTDGAIGAVAGIGIALLVAGARSVSRKSPQAA